MSGSRYRFSPAPSSVGFALNRRQLLVGAAGTAGLIGLSGLLSACGDDDDGASGGGNAKGTLTFGSNYSDAKPKAALAAAIAALPNENITTSVNTVDHNSFQENITNYLQQPDDVLAWFAGYRMRFFADKGLVGDISDVWGNLGGELSEGFKTASTGDDGKQYFVPFYYYPWAVHYRKSLFEEKGYTIPKTLDELKALADTMKSDGITPFAFGNDGKWPAMGTFDMINMRTNGYPFHVDLMAGKKDWTSPEVAQVFTTWTDLMPYFQEGGNGRTWQEGANALGDKSAGMYLLGTFVTSNFDPTKDAAAQAIIDDIDFFPYPAINPDHGQDAVEAPIDGFMMAAKPKNADAAKEMLGFLGTAPAQEAYLKIDPSSVAASSKADTSNYTSLQKKSAELVGSSKYISQFLDRDTNPEFASNVMGPALADFITDPSKVTSILKSVEEQKKAIFTS